MYADIIVKNHHGVTKSNGDGVPVVSMQLCTFYHFPYCCICSFMYSRGDIPYMFLNIVENDAALLNPQAYITSVMLWR